MGKNFQLPKSCI